ncbi:hypothetical protein RDI58_025179 [Solanum bulbocastanum]|uniref:Uncharacterized protein n=1 Tax=Solanum bulbocastanum TaxID=147425 RepID=A0AAN8T788_SOLBU
MEKFNSHGCFLASFFIKVG